ncbi:MAG: hypothetical protein KIT09_33790 [Bryobacteraceae bacterium]|nr:hypothetical protein [Bryobacteraceae bacterium]
MRRRDFVLAASALASAGAQSRKTLPSVLGPLAAQDLGVTLPHEHIAVASQEITRSQRDSLLSLWDMLGAQLRQNGVRTLVELTPADSGRDIALMKEVSQSTGLNILCATGYYVASARPANFLSGGVGAAEAYMTRELVEGIGDSGVKAALMKVAVGGQPANPSDNILLEAAGRVQKRTGAPISCHATTPDHRRHLVETLEKHGADMSRVAVGHADTNATLEESVELLSKGCYALYTIWGITNPRLIGFRGEVAADHSGRLIRGLLDKGLVKQILFSIDFAPTCLRGEGIDLHLYEVPGRTANYAFTFVLPLLRKLGVSDDEIHQMMVANPRRHLFGEG